jgi:hypothetical protein
MPRGLDAATKTALASDYVRLVNLIYLDIGSGVYITDHAIDLTYDSNTYESSNDLISIGEPKESRELRVNTLTLGLSGADQTYIALFLQNEFINKQAKFYKAVLQSDNVSIAGSPITMFDGRMVRWEINESRTTSEVLIEVASHWADFDKKAGRLTNGTSQGRFFDGDDGFEFAANTVKDLQWGRDK